MNSACDANVSSRPTLNESQVRHVLSNFEHADKLLSEIEGILTAASSKAAFPKFVIDITPAQARMVEDYLARLRVQMLRVLDSLDVHPVRPGIGALRALRVHLTFVRIAIEECTPNRLQGYGAVPDELTPELEGLSVELEGIVSTLDSALSGEPLGGDLNEKLARLSKASLDTGTLVRIDDIVTRHGLVEFRSSLAEIVDRLTEPRFEIALFGQVSCGKSSLLNQMIGLELLPVGVNPITSVPTRIVYATSSGLTVWFADRQVKRFAITELPEFVTEERNPGNSKGVARIIAGVPSDRLRDGVVLVDTPGLGSLTTSGATETRAYLPQCDLGIVLINSGATLGPEDVATIKALYNAGVQPAVVVSKADLLNSEDRPKASAYIEETIQHLLGVRLRVFPVSVIVKDRALLGQWFQEQIVPLYDHHKTLALESIRRKIGILSESIAKALKAKLRPSIPPPPNQLEYLRLADQRLRAASGSIGTAEKRATRAAESVANLASIALSSAARRLLEVRQNGGDAPATAIVREEIAEAARRATGEILAQVEQLTMELAAAADEAAASLGLRVPPLNRECEGTLRNVPQIDLTLIDFDSPLRFLTHFGRKAALYATEQQLNREVGKPASAALSSYSKILQTWIRATVVQIRDIFDAHADVYRAQLARLLDRNGKPGDHRDDLESDIHWLRGA